MLQVGLRVPIMRANKVDSDPGILPDVAPFPASKTRLAKLPRVRATCIVAYEYDVASVAAVLAASRRARPVAGV